ncbi:hypothetical protein BDZ89DRAFT_1045307 [Hymenopellis radicata]|nr:hypothetical protein BDZ89DRAFT_1045307 [Hymenopellis radicata]
MYCFIKPELPVWGIKLPVWGIKLLICSTTPLALPSFNIVTPRTSDQPPHDTRTQNQTTARCAYPYNEEPSPSTSQQTINMKEDATHAIRDETAGRSSFADSTIQAAESASETHSTFETIEGETLEQISLEFNCVEPLDDMYVLNAKLMGWDMPTVVSDNRQVYHTPIDEYTDIYLPPDMPEWLQCIITRDIPRRGSMTLPLRSRQLSSTPNAGIINDNPPIRRSSIHDPRSSFDARSSFSSSSTGSVYSSMLNAFGESAYNAASVAWNLDQLTGKKMQSAAPRMYPNSTRVQLSYSLHVPTKSILLMLTYTPVKISSHFYGFCGDRIGDFVIWGLYRTFRAFFLFTIFERDPNGVPWAFKDPRLLAVPRAFVERDHVVEEFAEEEHLIISDEWLLVPDGICTDRIDDAVEVGYGTILR